MDRVDEKRNEKTICQHKMEGERKTNANITIEDIHHSTERICFRRDDNAKQMVEQILKQAECGQRLQRDKDEYGATNNNQLFK